MTVESIDRRLAAARAERIEELERLLWRVAEDVRGIRSYGSGGCDCEQPKRKKDDGRHSCTGHPTELQRVLANAGFDAGFDLEDEA